MKGRILLVDDDPGASEVVTWILRQNRYSVKYFCDPKKALLAFKKNVQAFQAVIVDVHMPGMTGFEFARRIRKLCVEVRIILLTDFIVGKAEFRKVFPSLKIDDIVVKPTSPRQLLQAVSGAGNSGANDLVGGGTLRDYQNAR